MSEPSTPQSSNAFEIQRLYIQKQSCQVPHAPGIFQQELKDVKPETTVEMNIQNRPLNNDLFEIDLNLSCDHENPAANGVESGSDSSRHF